MAGPLGSDSAIVTSSRGGLKCFELFRRNDDEDNFYDVPSDRARRRRRQRR